MWWWDTRRETNKFRLRDNFLPEMTLVLNPEG